MQTIAEYSYIYFLSTYQHGGPEVELLLELGDTDGDLHKPVCVRGLHLPDDVRHPLEALLGPGHPDEVDL